MHSLFQCVFTFRDTVLLFAKFYMSDFSKIESSLLRNMLKRVGYKMEFWRTPGISL